MTVLAQLGRDRVSIQCDLCVPPVLTVNTLDNLRRSGWVLADDGGSWDVCPGCAARTAPRHRVPRRDARPAEPDPARLPNLVVIGATKAGTTSMHTYLGLHPEIAVSDDKELRFFQDPDGAAWIGRYQAAFATGTRYRAESTPFYSKAPCYPGVVDRMADLVPDARLIYLVRDPIDRIVAEYVEQTQWVSATRSLEDELADAEDPRNWLVASSRYATQLREYLRRFDQGRIKVIDLADLAADTAATLGEVFDFLELARPPLGPVQLQRLNTRDDKGRFPAWFLALRRGPIVRAVRRLPTGPRRVASQFAWKRLRSPVETPTLGEETRQTLRRVLKPEVDHLRDLTGLPFDSWSL